MRASRAFLSGAGVMLLTTFLAAIPARAQVGLADAHGQ